MERRIFGQMVNFLAVIEYREPRRRRESVLWEQNHKKDMLCQEGVGVYKYECSLATYYLVCMNPNASMVFNDVNRQG